MNTNLGPHVRDRHGPVSKPPEGTGSCSHANLRPHSDTEKARTLAPYFFFKETHALLTGRETARNTNPQAHMAAITRPCRTSRSAKSGKEGSSPTSKYRHPSSRFVLNEGR